MSPSAARPRFGLFLRQPMRDWEAQAVALLEQHGAECIVVEEEVCTLPPEPPRDLPQRVAEALVELCAGFPAVTGGAAGSPPALPRQRRVARGIEPCRRQNLAFILAPGGGEVPRWLAGCTQHGVWRFTRSDGIFGAVPFLYDLCLGRDVASFALHRLVPDGPPQELRGGRFRARKRSPLELHAEVTSQAAQWPLLVLKHLELNGRLPRSALDGPERGRRPSIEALLVALTLAAHAVGRFLERRLLVYLVLETWRVGLLRMSIEDIVNGAPLRDIRWLPVRKRGVSLADPFILSSDPPIRLLAEEFGHSERGKIISITLGGNPGGTPAVAAEVCLQSEHHMSYPYLFRDNGVQYCLPECYESGRSTLYNWDGRELQPVRDLLDDARITDASVVFDGKLYWLFCGIEDNRDQLNLHLFYAAELGGRWTAHPLNPVKTDVSSSRPAGQIFFRGGHFFRPAQDCSKSYGSALAINRIDVLSVTEFRETTVATVRPEAISRSCLGIHTLSFENDLVAIDAKFRSVGWLPVYVRCRGRVSRAITCLAGWLRPPRTHAAPARRAAAPSGKGARERGVHGLIGSGRAACPSE